jgi:hypothetical protein
MILFGWFYWFILGWLLDNPEKTKTPLTQIGDTIPNPQCVSTQIIRRVTTDPPFI